MSLIYWMPEYNTDIEIIDQQHRLLVNLINDLHDAYENGNDRSVLLKILGKIGIFAATHFAREEHLFEVHGYPHTEEHLEEHDYFEDMLFQFEDQYKLGNQDMNSTAISFLSDWLVNHINGTDQDYVPFLKSKGVK